MARARNIKPGLYKNEDLAECSIWARYLFPGLWMLADREGRLEDRPKRIKAELLAFDSQDVEPLLAELACRRDAQGVPFIVRYQNDQGRFIQISKFLDHQTPHYSEKASVIKAPTLQEKGGHIACGNSGSTPGVPQEDSRNSPGLKRGSQPPDSLNPDSLNPEGTPLSGSAPDPAPPKRVNGSAHYADAEDVLIYLNKAAGKGYEFRNRTGALTASADRIIARLKQGYTREELREVVHAKCAQWLSDDKMAEYLRPATLFAKENFEQYLGELKGIANG